MAVAGVEKGADRGCGAEYFSSRSQERVRRCSLEQPVLVWSVWVLDGRWRRSRLCRLGRLSCSNMLEDGGDNVGILDASDHAQLAAAIRAGLDIDREYPFQSLHPGHGSEGYVRFLLTGFAFWHDRLTMLAIRGEHAVEAGEVQSRARNQGGQAGDEVEWLEDDMGGAVAEWLLELVDDLSPLAGREPFVGDGGPGDVATEFLKLGALLRFTDGSGVERESWLLGEQGGGEGFGLCRDRAQGQCFLTGIGTDGNAVVYGRADELIEGLARLG